MNYTLTINGQAFAVSVAEQPPGAAVLPLACAPTPAGPHPAMAPSPAACPAPVLVSAGFAGEVDRIHAATAQTVAAGAPLVTVSGRAVFAPMAGLVKQILVNRGTLVRADDVLVVLI